MCGLPNQWFRFQEKYDMENSIEPSNSALREQQPRTSSTMEAIETDDDVLIITSTMEAVETDDDIPYRTDGEQENKSVKRRGYTSCNDCDIPFITKKELKVKLQ